MWTQDDHNKTKTGLCFTPKSSDKLFMIWVTHGCLSCTKMSVSLKIHDMENTWMCKKHYDTNFMSLIALIQTFPRVGIQNNSSENYRSFLDALDLLTVDQHFL